MKNGEHTMKCTVKSFAKNARDTFAEAASCPARRWKNSCTWPVTVGYTSGSVIQF